MTTFAERPILTLYRTPTRPWARFFDELLLQEGYCCFENLDLAEDTALDGVLAGRALVSIAAETLSEAQCEALARYVYDGGRLVLLRPCAELIDALKLEVHKRPGGSYGIAQPGYLQFTDHPWSAHHEGTFVQCHSHSDIWAIAGESLAMLAPQRGIVGVHPAIVETTCGSGRVVVFWFDPGTSLVLMRQGNPDMASDGRYPDYDGDGMHKSSGLFARHADYFLRDVPQADVLADVVVGIIRGLTDDILPIPRLWQLPANAPCLTLMDGDSDGYSQENFDRFTEVCEPAGIPYTVNFLVDDLRELSSEQIENFYAKGNDIQLHYTLKTNLPTVEQMREAIGEQVREFTELTGRAVEGARSHCGLWPGYTDTAETLAGAAVRMEGSFFPQPMWQYGYPNGSGRPARFMTHDGKWLDLYQQANILMDDMFFTDKGMRQPMSAAEAREVIARVFEESVTRYHGVINSCIHPGKEHMKIYGDDQLALLKAVVQATVEHGLPALTVHDWSSFTLARRAARLSYSESGWTLDAPLAVKDLTIHQPADRGEIRQGLTWSVSTHALAAGERLELS